MRYTVALEERHPFFVARNQYSGDREPLQNLRADGSKPFLIVHFFTDSGLRFLLIRRDSGYAAVVPEVIFLRICDNRDVGKPRLLHDSLNEFRTHNPLIVIGKDNRIRFCNQRGDSIKQLLPQCGGDCMFRLFVNAEQMVSLSLSLFSNGDSTGFRARRPLCIGADAGAADAFLGEHPAQFFARAVFPDDTNELCLSA